MTKNYTNPETIGLHVGWRKDETTNSVAVPIHQTTSYQFNDTDHASNLFALSELGNIYSRIMNPTCAVLEERIAALEGGVGALAVASGQAASAYAIQNIAKAGDNIVHHRIYMVVPIISLKIHLQILELKLDLLILLILRIF